LKKFGLPVKRILTHLSVNKLLDAPKTDSPIFYITSYQFLSLDTQRLYDPWTCIKHDKDGNVYHRQEGNSSRTCSGCGRSYEMVQRVCPKCESQEAWTGGHCHQCGYQAWTYTSETTQYPAYKRLKKGLFDCMLIDEAQEAKSKNSFRGRAIRAIRTKGVALLTGTLMKGYISDVFWNVGKLMGFGNLLFPYPYRGGSKMFLDEFGTYEYISKQFADTLHEGRARLLPEVSNLNRFWRILSSFTVRRLKDTMVELPPKHKHYELVSMTALQTEAYSNLEEWAKKKIQEALQQKEPNMGKISQALWKLRFAATVPIDQDKLGDYAISAVTWAKLDRIVELAKEIKKRGEQVVIFASLRSMVQSISDRLKVERLSHVKITASTDVQKRLALIDDFEMNGHVALVAGTNCANRAFTITSANNVIIANLEFSPEPTLQAEDRVHRTGQEKEVNVHYLISENTIDQDMWELITKKGEAIKHAIDMEARDISVAELLQSKAELEVAIRILGRKKTKPASPTMIKAKLPDETASTLPSSKVRKPQKPKSEDSWQGTQLDFFAKLTKNPSPAS
jgi:SNF2 family DNA or RNA helicase